MFARELFLTDWYISTAGSSRQWLVCVMRRGDARDEMCEAFYWEHYARKAEHKRLENLMVDVMWYNFETAARHWKHPWATTIGTSRLQLHGVRLTVSKGRDGRPREKGEFPMYYDGAVDQAPILPPAILLSELKSAWDEMQAAKENCNAVYDWAPGGKLYEHMLKESAGVREYENMRGGHSSDHTV